MVYLFLALGGVAGTLARYGVGRAFAPHAAGAFPWHTFAINLSGSLVLGFAMRLGDTVALSPETRALVMVGFCGAFTTFSTFSWETVVLIQNGHWSKAAAYSLGSVAAGLAAVFVGMMMAGALVRLRG